MNYSTFSSPLGPISFGYKNNSLFTLTFGGDCQENSVSTSFEIEVVEAITLYLTGSKEGIDVPFSIDLLSGTPFQKEVWRSLCRISYGKTKTYGEIAQEIGRPHSSQAVGNACGANPLPLLIPCHRIVARNGIGGFSAGLAIKETLLQLEGILIL